MIESANGIILRTRLLTETSLIVNWLTAEHGRISTVARGARRPKLPFVGKLDLFHEARFTFSRSRRSQLHTLRELKLTNNHAGLRRELGWLQQASYAATLIEQTTETETPIAPIHALMTGMLAILANQSPRPRTIYAFELKLLNELGLFPDLAKTHLTPEARELIQALLVSNWRNIAGLRATAAEAKELRQFLHGFLIFHLGRVPRNRNAALSPDSPTAIQVR